MNKLITAIAVLALGVAAPVTADDVEEALAAHQRRDYQSAFRLLLPLAEQGNAGAQYNLAQLYAAGAVGPWGGNTSGGEESDREAMKWYHTAAEHGLAKAQFQLGEWYIRREDYYEQNWLQGARGLDGCRSSAVLSSVEHSLRTLIRL